MSRLEDKNTTQNESSNAKPDNNAVIYSVIDESYILEKYDKNIGYNWRSAQRNKKTYQTYRLLPIFLGAFLTFATAISSTEYISSNPSLKLVFAIGTPLLAVLLTISNELFKLSGWAENWRDNMTYMFQLEKMRDDYLASPVTGRDFRKELEKINNLALKSTRTFFKRTLLDESKSPKESNAEDSEESKA